MSKMCEDPKASYFIIDYDSGDIHLASLKDAIEMQDSDYFQVLKLSDGVLYYWNNYWYPINGDSNTEGMGL